MKHKRYNNLIGRKVRITLCKYRNSAVYEGTVVGVSGFYLGLQQDDGSFIWVPKLSHFGDKLEVLENGKWSVWKEIRSI